MVIGYRSHTRHITKKKKKKTVGKHDLKELPVRKFSQPLPLNYCQPPLKGDICISQLAS